MRVGAAPFDRRNDAADLVGQVEDFHDRSGELRTAVRLDPALISRVGRPASMQGLTNLGEQKPEASLPFTMTQVTTLSSPWRIAFLPDGRMLITEKTGALQLVTQDGKKAPVANVPKVVFGGQGGMLGVYLSPHYATDHSVYLTYSEPGDGGSSLALAKAQLKLDGDKPSLEDLKVIWRDGERGDGGQFGAFWKLDLLSARHDGVQPVESQTHVFQIIV